MCDNVRWPDGSDSWCLADLEKRGLKFPEDAVDTEAKDFMTSCMCPHDVGAILEHNDIKFTQRSYDFLVEGVADPTKKLTRKQRKWLRKGRKLYGNRAG